MLNRMLRGVVAAVACAGVLGGPPVEGRSDLRSSRPAPSSHAATPDTPRAGYLVANGELRDLPQGAKLDPASGVFTWMPGVGYLGRYGLVFVRGGEQIRIRAVIGSVR